MSAISSLGTTPTDLSTVLQQLNDGQTNSAAAAPSNPTSLLDETSNSSTKGVPEPGQHHHGGSEKLKQIQSAVTSALQAAPSGSDPNTIIQNAIAQALQQSNSPSANSGASAQDSSSAASSQPQSPQEFQSVLSSYGVSAQEFGQDFQAAIKQSGVGFPPGAFTDVAA